MLMISESVRHSVEDELDLEPTGDGIERRRDVRIMEKRPVKVFDAVAAKYFGGQTEDISSTGLRLELPSSAPIETGDTLCVHVGLNRRGESLANRRQMIPAKVVWVNRQDRRISGRIEAGIEFLSNISARLDAA
jgi:hypothetical protein